MSYINYKDVKITYGSDEVLCRDLTMDCSNSLEDSKTRAANKTGVVYGTERPVTRINLNYLIGSGGDPFYKDFEEIFNGNANISEFESQTLLIGSSEFTGLYPESLSISASENSFFNASVNLVAYSIITGQLLADESPNSEVFEADIDIGHSANSPLVGATGTSITLNCSIQQNPIYLLGSSGAPGFVDIISRRKECNVNASGFSNFVEINGGEDVEISLTVNSLNGEPLQDYGFTGKVQSTNMSLSAGDVASVDMSLVSFI
tara:strand:+ start:7083 stop:7868 length:786 start_codon:yes stop_codon:yes gene_type:complete